MSAAVIISSHAAALVDVVRKSTVQVKSAERGIGTGVIWRSTASASEIVTNAHVVAGAVAGQIRVTLADGREAPAEVLTSDAQLDLALLRVGLGQVDAAHVALIGALRVGEIVFAIGNPWGQVGVVTQGVVSGSGSVALRNGRSARYIRSDVQLAPGNSGGPLVNAAGEVVGINAMIFGGDLSVAIPSDIVVAWVAGQPDRPVRLGIGVQPVTVPEHGAALVVVAVEPDGIAAQSLLIGDVLLGIDDARTPDAGAFQHALLAAAKQGRARLNVWRGGAIKHVDIAV